MGRQATEELHSKVELLKNELQCLIEKRDEKYKAFQSAQTEKRVR